MKVKTHIDIKDIDIQIAGNLKETIKNNIVLKSVSSISIGANSCFAFGVVKSIPVGHILKNDENSE